MPTSDINRTVLPIPDRPYVGLIPYDAKDPEAKFPPIRDIRPPAGAPNVLVVMLDDTGFGASSAFGGPCQTPNFERLAAGGLKYTRFHTTAICSPSRQALLTGRNHHSCGMGALAEMATSAPGYTTVLPNSVAPLAKILTMNGYSTAHLGKCHEVPSWQNTAVGPFDGWPSMGRGFEYFYGFVGGETNQFYPALYEGTSPIEPPKTPEEGYHLNDDLATRTIGWIRQQKALAPDRPFFAYLAPGATHAPHHVPLEWADKYRGQFDRGWDEVRADTLARQKALGVVPADCELTERSEGIPAWDEVRDEMKPVLARQMEVYAGFLEHTDHHIGRVFDAIDDLGILDNTLIFLLVGDNGASAEGSLQGTYNEYIPLTGFGHLETAEFLTSKLDKFGSPESYNHYAVGWAHAMNAPYQWTKQIASHFGGTRVGMIAHWPKGIEAKGEVRNQFTHLIDIAATVLEAAGIPEPLSVNGVQQRPIEGTSMVYSFHDADAPERHRTQYFEMMGNRGIYHDGWTAVTRHRTPWITTSDDMRPFDDDVWELYDTTTDWSQARNIAADHPDKLHELQRLWLIEATRFNVLPLDDRYVERSMPELSGRPELIKGTRQVMYSGMGRISGFNLINILNKSYSITTEISVPARGASGVIVANGGIIGGWSIYAKEGKLKYAYNFYGLHETILESQDPLAEGTHQIRLEFTYDGGGRAKGGVVNLFVDGAPVAEGRLEETEPLGYSADETVDLGNDFGSPVTADYPTDRKFSGEVNWVEFAIGDDAIDDDHMITPEERFRIVMAQQ